MSRLPFFILIFINSISLLLDRKVKLSNWVPSAPDRISSVSNSLTSLVDQPATLANRLFSIPDRSTMLTHSLAMLNWLTMLAESQIPDLNWKPSVYKTDALPIVLIWQQIINTHLKPTVGESGGHSLLVRC